MASGKTRFRWHAEGQFFSNFENSEILDADLVVGVKAEKSGHYVGVDIDIDGSVVVACDRCLGDLTLPVSVHPAFSVKFGEGYEEAPSDEEGREVLILPETDTDLDISQIVYDYVCTSLPLFRTHPEGECDPETVKYLSSQDEEDDADVPEEMPSGSPFASLKDLLDGK